MDFDPRDEDSRNDERARHSFQTFDSQTHSIRSAPEPQSLRSRAVHYVELMSRRQDLELKGSPIADPHAESQK